VLYCGRHGTAAFSGCGSGKAVRVLGVKFFVRIPLGAPNKAKDKNKPVISQLNKP